MKRTEVASFIISACSYIRLSQAKTLSNLVAAAMKLTRASLAELGRALANQNGVAAKHCIKRVDRFVGNYRIEPSEAVKQMVKEIAPDLWEIAVAGFVQKAIEGFRNSLQQYY